MQSRPFELDILMKKNTYIFAEKKSFCITEVKYFKNFQLLKCLIFFKKFFLHIMKSNILLFKGVYSIFLGVFLISTTVRNICEGDWCTKKLNFDHFDH